MDSVQARQPSRVGIRGKSGEMQTRDFCAAFMWEDQKLETLQKALGALGGVSWGSSGWDSSEQRGSRLSEYSPMTGHSRALGENNRKQKMCTPPF